jgi:heme/copper-type cytochrome/quinol oxidase subunit 1
VPLVLGLAVVPLWFAPRTAALWRWLPAAVSGLAVIGIVAVLAGLATGPSDDYGWYAYAPLTADADVRYVDGRMSPILLALAGLAIQAGAGLARRRAARPLVR